MFFLYHEYVLSLDLKVCFEVQEQLSHQRSAFPTVSDPLRVYNQEESKFSSPKLQQLVSEEVHPVHDLQEKVSTAAVSPSTVDIVKKKFVERDLDPPQRQEMIERNLSSQTSKDISHEKNINDSGKAKGEKVLHQTSTQLLTEDETQLQDFLIETTEVAGKPKTRLKTVVQSYLLVKKLSPEERVIFEKNQQILKTEIKLQTQQEKINSLQEAQKLKPVSKRGVLLKLSSTVGPLTQKDLSARHRGGFFGAVKRFLTLSPYGNKYFFVLSGRFLLYFSSYPSSTPRRMIDLLEAKAHAVKSKYSPTGFEIRLNAVVRTPIEIYRKVTFETFSECQSV